MWPYGHGQLYKDLRTVYAEPHIFIVKGHETWSVPRSRLPLFLFGFCFIDTSWLCVVFTCYTNYFLMIKMMNFTKNSVKLHPYTSLQRWPLWRYQHHKLHSPPYLQIKSFNLFVVKYIWIPKWFYLTLPPAWILRMITVWLLLDIFLPACSKLAVLYPPGSNHSHQDCQHSAWKT